MDAPSLVRIALSLFAVVVAIGALAYGVQRSGAVSRATSLRGVRRLQVVEATAIDPRRRLVVVRCDDAEHLLLLGVTGELHLGALPARPLRTTESPSNDHALKENASKDKVLRDASLSSTDRGGPALKAAQAIFAGMGAKAAD